jgi:putative addiction module component (TIGR02574 family)
MGATMKELGIDQWSVDDRIRLAQEIWGSLGPRIPELTPEQREELRRRDDELDKHPEKALTWEEIKARVRGTPGVSPCPSRRRSAESWTPLTAGLSKSGLAWGRS